MRSSIFVAIIILYVLQAPIVLVATELIGTIAAKRGDTVKVEFKAHKIAKPEVGDVVHFKVEIAGEKVGAGNGKVIEVNDDFIWVQTDDKRPDLKMRAVIQATGLRLGKMHEPVANNSEYSRVRARHILVKTQEAAQELIAQLNSGADFAVLATLYSTGPSGEKGGNLGWFRRGEMVPSFEAAAFSLQPNSFTLTPVKTQFGWHVIFLEAVEY